MKRAEKKITTPEKSVPKSKKPAAAKIAEQKKTANNKKSAAEKPVKKLKPETSPKDLKVKETTLSSKKTKPVAAENRAKKLKPETSVKVSKEKALTSKQTIKIIAQKPARKTNAAVSVKIPVTPKAKKTTGKAVEPEKSAPLKKKTAAAQAKSAGRSKPVKPAKIAVSKPEVKKSAPGNSVSKQRKEKSVQPVLEKRPKTKKEPVLPKAADRKAGPARKKVEIVVPAINRKQNKITAENKVKTVVPASRAKSGKKIVTDTKIVKKDGGKVEKKIEIVIPPIAAKPVRKKIKPIGSAVVRGKTRRYDFEVFPLDADLKDGSAIYVISKRITDKRGRGHHKFVCIGQTESLLGEIKKHKRDKCIKQHKANVICLLREESETNRLKIETDLREAHTIACNQK